MLYKDLIGKYVAVYTNTPHKFIGKLEAFEEGISLNPGYHCKDVHENLSSYEFGIKKNVAEIADYFGTKAKIPLEVIVGVLELNVDKCSKT